MQIEKKDIRALSKEQLRDFFISNQDKAFRGNQVYEWLWSKGAHSFDDMTNVSKETRLMLEDNFVINHIKVDTMQRSSDGTVKNAVRLYDGLIVESVLIPTGNRTTACVSSQVGCSLDCSFCATARLKKMRNLNPDEIFDQVAAINQESLLYYNHKLSNVVFMGMGEPMANYKSVMHSIRNITNPQPDGLGIGARSVTLSTVGLVSGIEKLIAEDLPVTLAISLHTPDDELRDSLVPVNSRWKVKEVLAAADRYEAKTGRRYSIEYALIRDINDQVWRADLLGRLLKNKNAHVNLIPLNPTPGSKWTASRHEDEAAFVETLEGYGVPVTVRDTRGREIDGACGQLAASELSNNSKDEK